jgi:hypothetical protein
MVGNILPACGRYSHSLYLGAVGDHYDRGTYFGDGYNSNTWVYNMLILNPAGRIEPPPIARYDAPGWGANDSYYNYYPK